MRTLDSFFVDTILFNKIGNFVEEISTNEFVTQVGDRIFVETGKNLSDHEVKEIIGERIQPMLIEYSKLFELVNNQ
jgi:hypothetical protein